MLLARTTLCAFALYSALLMTAFADDSALDNMSDAQVKQFCAAHGDTLDLEDCANHDFKKADAKLNNTYNKVIAQLKTMHVQNPKTLSALPELIKAQRLWVSFCDTECGAHYTYYIDGTIRGLMFIGCKIDLTEQREKDLQAFYLSTN